MLYITHLFFSTNFYFYFLVFFLFSFLSVKSFFDRMADFMSAEEAMMEDRFRNFVMQHQQQQENEPFDRAASPSFFSTQPNYEDFGYVPMRITYMNGRTRRRNCTTRTCFYMNFSLLAMMKIRNCRSPRRMKYKYNNNCRRLKYKRMINSRIMDLSRKNLIATEDAPFVWTSTHQTIQRRHVAVTYTITTA